MSETVALLLDATARLLSQPREGLWPAAEAMGLPLALVPEERGGFGLPAADTLALVRLFGAEFVAAPLPETMVANHLLARAGLPLADGPAAAVPGSELWLANGRLSGRVERVPWGRDLATLVVELDGGFVRLSPVSWRVAQHAENLAGMPRDTLAIDAEVDLVAPSPGVGALAAGAVVRSLQIAGALERVLALTVEHVRTRVQFGRSLGAFQAVQQELARAAGEVAAADAAAGIAAEAFERDLQSALPAIAAARLRTAEAAGVTAGIAHQLHGAIGFTAEHPLRRYTTVLWAWRDEFGAHRHWAGVLGRAALGAGPEGYWPWLTAAA